VLTLVQTRPEMHLDPVNIGRDDVFGVRGESPGYAVNPLKTVFQSFPMKAMPHARKRLRRGQAKFLAKRKAMQVGTLVRITKTKAAPNALFPPGRLRPGNSAASPRHSLPVAYAMEGVLLADVEVGKPVCLARMARNGEEAVGLFTSIPLVSVTQDGFATANPSYRIELGGEPGEFARLAQNLIQELLA